MRREAVPLLKTEAVTRATCAIVARGAEEMVKVERASSCFWGVAGGVSLVGRAPLCFWSEARFLFSESGEDRGGVGGPLAGVEKAARAFPSIRSIVPRTISKAFRKSPVCAVTLRARSLIASGRRKGSSAVGGESAGRRERSLVVMTESISVTV